MVLCIVPLLKNVFLFSSAVIETFRVSFVTSSDCDVRRQNSIQEQRPSWRSLRHFENFADVAENRRIKGARFSKHYTGKGRVDVLFETQVDMCKNNLLSWTLTAIVDSLRAYRLTL